MSTVTDMLPLRYRRQTPSVNGLKNPTNDPSIPLSEGSQTPVNPHLAQAMQPSINGNDFHQTIPQASRPSLADSHNWTQNYVEPSEDIPFDEYIDYGEDLPVESVPQSAPQMAVGPSQSSESSHSSSSSKRHKSNDGSARSSFSQTNGGGMPGADYSYPGVILPSGGHAFGNGNQLYSTLHDVDAMNQMASNLAVRSTGNSSPDSTDSNTANGQTIAGVPMPYETSPNMQFEPLAMTEPAYLEPAVESAEASPLTTAWPQSTLPGPFVNNVTLPNDPSLTTMPTQAFMPYPENDVNHWYLQNLPTPAQPPALANQRQNCQKMFLICGDPPASGPYFAVMSSRTGTRVETALDIRLLLRHPPPDLKKLRVHEEHVAKVKHLKENHIPLQEDTLELRATVFCATHLSSAEKIQRAMDRAARLENPSSNEQNMNESSPPKGSDKCTPKEGFPVQICPGCVSREAKRLRRSKQKTEETEEWLQNASRKTLVINSGQIVEWKFPPDPKEAAERLMAQHQPRVADDDRDEDGRRRTTRKLPLPPVEPGTVAADLAMRICCYCRHQHESTGFRVVFTLTDHHGRIYAQQVTNPIMITDDHKDKDKKDSAPPTPPQNAESTQPPSHFTFQNGPAAPQFSAGIQQSYSTPNLTAMAQGHALVVPENMGTPQPFQIFQPAIFNNTDTPYISSGTLTPQTRSRQASPTGASGPQAKKRKASGLARVDDKLRMTPMDQAQSSNSGPYGVATARRTQAQSQRLNNRLSHPTGTVGYRTNPPSPPSTGFGPFTESHRSQSMENVASATFSVPASAHQSRQSSPPSVTQGSSMGYQPDLAQALDYSLRNVQVTDSFGQQHPTSQQPRSQPALPQPQLSGQGVPSSYPAPPSIPTIEQILPNWGSVNGGNRCAVLGTGFCPGVQVFFGNRAATSVHIRQEGTLTCIAPPSDQPGMVPIHIYLMNPQRLPTPEAEPMHFYQYVPASSPDLGQGQGQIVPIQDGTTSPVQPGNYQNGMQQWPAMNGIGQYQQQYPQQQYPQHRYGFTHQRYGSESGPGYAVEAGPNYHHSRRQSFTETPPSYHDVLAEDDQRKMDMKTSSMLRAVGDALMDQKAQEAFDTTTAAASQSTDTKTSYHLAPRKMERVTIGRNPVSEEQKAKLRAERRKKVKGLKSDKKLWAVWLPILILVVIAMTYDRLPLIWSVICALVGYIKEVLFPSIQHLAERSVGYVQDRIVGMRLVEVG